MDNAHADPGWGIYGQRVTMDPMRHAQHAAAGLRTISYFETYGEAYTFVGELAPPDPGRGHRPVQHTHWTWANYADGPVYWI